MPGCLYSFSKNDALNSSSRSSSSRTLIDILNSFSFIASKRHLQSQCNRESREKGKPSVSSLLKLSRGFRLSRALYMPNLERACARVHAIIYALFSFRLLSRSCVFFNMYCRYLLSNVFSSRLKPVLFTVWIRMPSFAI